MRNTITSILLLITSILYSQNKKLLNILPLTRIDKIGFASYDKEFKMYREPIIISNGKKYKVKGYDSENYSDGKILSISPNKKFIALDYIIKGYVDDGISKRLHENYYV